ncbi:MAG: hypothetical protein HOL28_07025 [Crocinitomicaceae bacterium]|nr:hypothetical protein [Crocinitomicaceae bacterium]
MKDVFSVVRVPESSIAEKQAALDQAIDWLFVAQDKMVDDGFGSYHFIDGWGASYPETSGYIISSLVEYAKVSRSDEVMARCVKCANWLLSIQKQSGGWQSMTLAQSRPEVVFNTGQVIRGLYSIYKETQHEKYLQACIKAIDWLCSVQDDDGAWRKHAYMGLERVYDSYVDAPILEVSAKTKNDLHTLKAIKNLNWIIDNKQKENGWFLDCDNTIHKNDRPILHTIAYTIDGLLDSAQYLSEKKFFNAAKIPAEKLLDIFLQHGTLAGRFNYDWSGSESTILTGCAQISICWLKIFRETNENKFFIGAEKMNSFLVAKQNRTMSGTSNTKGAITGSYPVWGRYENFSCPNWATKYFVDALLLELSIKSAD